MANDNKEAEAKLQKLGERVREGWMQENPTTDKQLESIRGVIRDEWEKERTEKTQSLAEQDAAKPKDKESPDLDR